MIFRRDDLAEIQVRRALRVGERKLTGEDKQLVSDVRDSDEKIAIVVDAITVDCKNQLAASGVDLKVEGEKPLLEAILAFIKDLIENPEKLVKLIQTLAPLFVMV